MIRKHTVELTKKTHFSMPLLSSNNVYVVVNFFSQVTILFLLFLGMVMYANEVETKEKEKLCEIKN